MSVYDLDRFVRAQNILYDRVIDELAVGRKRSHWMWFIFPQIAGLGFSSMAQRYAIGSQGETRAYLAHDVLGPRLIECTNLVFAVRDRSIFEIFEEPDGSKFRSSMTLFHMVSQRDVFVNAIKQFFPAGHDPKTLEILNSHDSSGVRRANGS